MKFMSWTLHKPTDDEFAKFAKLKAGQPWYGKEYEILDPDASQSWSNISRKTFFQMIEKFPDKFYAMGLHEFGVDAEGKIRNTATWSSNPDPGNYVLSTGGDSIARPCAKSLCYLMHTYPGIKWSLQYLCTNERVPPIIYNTSGAQDTFINQCYKVTDLYIKAGFPIRGVEIDFEYTWYGSGATEANAFRDFLARVKNEVCLPLGVELRINLFAMTGKFEPSWYAWHDYETLASAKDKNGNQAVDEFQMMSYDFSWGGSAPGPSTPLWWLESILKHVNNVLPPEKTFVGNAGYGRRWALGEDVYGTTADYKGLMLIQNGMFIHNQGNTDRDDISPDFDFFDQDFIPICGFNDPDSDYQITYLHTYDRFKMSSNGGADFRNMNRSDGADYVTKYSTDQNAIFTGVSNIINDITEKTGIVDNAGTFSTDSKTTGIPINTTFKGYAITNTKAGSENDEIIYKFSATGNKRLIAVVSFPFYDQSEFSITINNVSHKLGIGDDWYPLLQKRHFYDMGVVNFTGENVIKMGLSNGCQLFGFVLCDSFSHNMLGGYIDVPACVYPMMKRGEIDSSTGGTEEIIEAQYPKTMRIVGEVLRRPPRPAIIWEDMFGSYDAGYEEYIKDITTAYKYYRPSPEGYSKGEWRVYPNPEKGYAHALGDGTSGYNQLILNKVFNTNIVVDIEAGADTDYPEMSYGVRVNADVEGSNSDGYLVLLNFSNGYVELYNETSGNKSRLAYWNMPNYVKNSMNSRIRLRCFLFRGKLSFYIDDNSIISNYSLPTNNSGASGIYVNGGKVKVYKYNISSLDRYERMERMSVKADGRTYSFGEVPRICEFDEYGYIKFSGYPQEVGLSPNITDTQVDKNYVWETDYKNLKLATIPAWKGRKDIEINTCDAGIWVRSIYIGDEEGMSIAYNSDMIGFIKTVNMIYDYNCKGVAMWCLGQEDPTYYSYLP